MPKQYFSAKSTGDVLPVGAKFQAVDRNEAKVVDHSNALPMFHKRTGNKMAIGSDIFKPADPNASAPRSKTKGQNLHTDPFAEDRAHYVPPTKKLISPHIDAPHVSSRQHVPRPVQPDRKELVTANGLIFRGGKVVKADRSAITMNNEPKKVDHAAMARFRSSKAGARGAEHDPTKGGIKRVPGSSDAHQKTLVGVLRMEEKKPARQYNYRPPWGTCNTPRTPPTNRGAKPASYGSPTPWATTPSATA